MPGEDFRPPILKGQQGTGKEANGDACCIRRHLAVEAVAPDGQAVGALRWGHVEGPIAELYIRPYPAAILLRKLAHEVVNESLEGEHMPPEVSRQDGHAGGFG